MLNNASSQSSLRPSSLTYYYARLRRRKIYRAAKKGGRKHAKRRSFKKRHFPFHRLPRETIAEIFVLCLPNNSIKSKNAAPLLLCNVSPSWRSLALSVPHLWNELSIRIVNPEVDIDFATAMVDSWIARSGELPLSLRLDISPWSEKGHAMTMVKAHLNTFFCYASRWGSVEISLFGGSGSAVSFPKLGRKFLYSTSWPIPIPFPFTSCPLLSTFRWPFSCFISSSCDLDIPWHQLTHIKLEHLVSTHQTLDILRTCQALVKLDISIDDDLSLDQVRQGQKPVENRNLRSFNISVYQICSGLLQSLTLPALTEFSLDIDFESPVSISTCSIHTELLRLFTRSKCKLEKLKLGDCGFNDAGILKCLKHDSCSSLMELEVANAFNRPMFTDKVILALTDKDGLSEVNSNLLPNLSRLSLEMCLSASPGALGFMVITRCLWWDNDDRLKFLSLTVRDDLHDFDRALLKVAGLDVEITIDHYTDSEFAADVHNTDDN